MPDVDEAVVELQRCVDRLRTMPLHRLAQAAPLAYVACGRLLESIGDTHELPRLADHAAGDQLAVIGAEVLGTPGVPIDGITRILADLRRSLP